MNDSYPIYYDAGGFPYALILIKATGPFCICFSGAYYDPDITVMADRKFEYVGNMESWGLLSTEVKTIYPTVNIERSLRKFRFIKVELISGLVSDIEIMFVSRDGGTEKLLHDQAAKIEELERQLTPPMHVGGPYYPTYTTDTRPSPLHVPERTTIFNTTTGEMQVSDGTDWIEINEFILRSSKGMIDDNRAAEIESWCLADGCKPGDDCTRRELLADRAERIALLRWLEDGDTSWCCPCCNDRPHEPGCVLAEALK